MTGDTLGRGFLKQPARMAALTVYICMSASQREACRKMIKLKTFIGGKACFRNNKQQAQKGKKMNKSGECFR